MAEPKVNRGKTMKIALEKTAPRELKSPSPDPPNKQNFHLNPPRRRIKDSASGFRMKFNPSDPSDIVRLSRPQTPLLRWKFDEINGKISSIEDENNSAEVGGELRRKMKSTESSSRKIGAGMWRLHSPEVKSARGKGFRVQYEGGDHFGTPLHGHYKDSYDLFKLSNAAAMEGVTKWDPTCSKESADKFNQIFTTKPNRSNKSVQLIAALEKDLERAKSRINELETERRSSKKKLEQFLHKFSEERASWKKREHEKIRLFIDDVKSELTREKKDRQSLEKVNSKMARELADAKVLTKRCLQEYEKERKTREMIEEVCDELAKEMRQDKNEIESMKREYGELHEEVEEERKMLQLAEVWREERVQMKLADAKTMLEEKYSYMNRLVEELESFLNCEGEESNVEESSKKAEFLHGIASSVDIKDVRELKYEPPNPDDIFSIFEDRVLLGTNEKEIETCDSPVSDVSRSHTVSPVVKILREEKFGSGELQGEEEEEEEDSSEATSNERRQMRKGISVSKLWRSHRKNNGDHRRIIQPFEGRKGRR